LEFVAMCAMPGDDDWIVPPAHAGQLKVRLICGADLKVCGGVPHGLCATTKDQENADPLAFVERNDVRRAAVARRRRLAPARWPRVAPMAERNHRFARVLA
jgi:hypothetical protein